MSASPNSAPRKTVQRAFSRRLVGLPAEVEDIPARRVEAQSSVIQMQATVDRLMETVASASTGEQVKQAVQTAFSSFAPSTSSAPKRRRGRPRLWSSNAERKRVQRIRAKEMLVQSLTHFGLELGSIVPPGFKAKYKIEVCTYRELLESERVQTKVLKEITRELKSIGAIPNPSPVNKKTGLPLLSNGRFLTDAPAGKGELVRLSDPAKLHGLRQQRERGLSRPGDDEQFLDIPKSILGDDNLPTGDRRRKQPQGHGPDGEAE